MQFFCIVLICSFVNYSFTSESSRPKIVTQDGHLSFVAAQSKNISFQTYGGIVHINGIDVLKSSKIAHKALESLKTYQMNFDSSLDKISRFERLLDDGVLQKVINMQGFSNTSLTPDIPNNSPMVTRNIRRLNRRVNSIQRELRLIRTLLNTNECSSNPCLNGGTCLDLFNGFICQCPQEWEGSLCEKDVNECARFSGTDLGCQNGATCVNEKGSYKCVCSHGWFGTHCTQRTKDCKSGSGVELCGHGTCVTQYNDVGYKCICDQGWTTDGTSPACNTDVNECQTGRHLCSVNPPVPCINLPGSFHCGSCPQGYSGNGYYCSDIDECAISNGGCSSNPMVQCINTLGSRICGSCPPGYAGDGITCSYEGVCAVNNGGCHRLATCRSNFRNSSTLVECVCPTGFRGNGIGPNGCIPEPPSGPCSPNPCRNGICRVNGTSYRCDCYGAYTGRNCEIFRGFCANNPCQNGGTCVFRLGLGLRCNCPPTHTGSRCQTEKQACGGQLRTESGSLAFPSVQLQSYGNSLSCAWTIETNTTKILNITFLRFNVEQSFGCRYDWLQIHDGKNTLARSIGRFCGNNLPNGGTIISTHNIVYLWFRSDHSVSSQGFNLTWTSMIPVCGDDVKQVTSHGKISSPGSPGNYPNNRDCYWPLLAEAGKRILFHFFSLMIGNSTKCDGDYLEFISGNAYTDPVFAKFCNTTHPSPLFSPGAEVLVHFHSDSNGTYPGFQITYSVVEAIPGCGGVYTRHQDEIRSPSYNGNYPNDIQCEYRIKLLEKSRIRITFLSFELEEADSCSFDYVAIYAGATVDSPLIGKYCGNQIPPTYTTESNELLIVFKTDWATTFAGFVMKYETVCGGKYTSSNGIIESPNYPQQYSHSMECIYEIIQPLGTTIKLNILDIDLESNSYPDCTYDFLEIRDGHNENATLVGKYCLRAPKQIISSFNYLYVKFQSDANQEGRGFQANYTTINIGCGGILKDKTGTFSTPNYPEVYTPGSTCKWILVAPPGNVIQIMWMTFQLEKSHECTYDFVQVFENNTETGKSFSMGKFCGQVSPPTMLSNTNMVTVAFRSDDTQHMGGFLASYNFISESNVCGGNYYTNAGVLRSPGYPQNYPVNIDCVWKIQVPSGQQILLNVTDFSLEKYSVCRFDWLEIRNGGTAMSPLLGKFCGDKIPKLIPSHANRLYIQFRSDMTKTERGFKIVWEATSTGCGGTLNSPTGSIISPNYPEPYTENGECIWKISISTGSLIELVFSDLDLEEHTDCQFDHIEILDGPSLNSKSLGRFCSFRPSALRSSSNNVVVVFKSDMSRNGRGFQLQYTTMCNNTLKGFRGVIESPNFPEPYPGGVNCNWEIEVAKENKINISFSHFNLEKLPSMIPVGNQSSSSVCIYDYVEILYTQLNEFLEESSFIKYGSYCGDETPPLISLNSYHAKIHFASDNMIHGNGFRLEWQLYGCGDILTKPSGNISSPNYPNPYPASVECNWKIEVDFGQHIEITFDKLELEKTSVCHLDYIRLFNGEDETYPEIAIICHQEKPITLRSSGNVMFIKFKADSSVQGTGFTARYVSKSTKCGGKYTSDRASIMSPNYPQNYDVNDTCGYQIEVGESYMVSLNFEDFDLYSDENTSCSVNNNSFVKVYDGPSTTYPTLAKLCGKAAPNKSIVSTTNKMFVEMVTRTDSVAKGFLAKYRKTCGARIETDGTGIIKLDPNDLDYDEYNCSWTILAKDPSKKVSLTISHLDTMSSFCADSYYALKIYNGLNSDSPILGNYCGTKVPPTLTSSGPAMHIDLEYNSVLFATYTIFDNHCGGTLTSLDGFFASPGYPKKYPMDVECEWTISVTEGNHVSLSFIYFELLESEHCNTDYLEIRQYNATGKHLGTFCGSDLPTNITHIGSLWIFLKTSQMLGDTSGLSAKGFQAEYVLNHENELTGPLGRIVSPLYGTGYPLYGEYSWQISVNYGKRILLTFKELNIESGVETCFSSVSVFDGLDGESPLLGEFCGNTPSNSIKSTTNTLFIKFNGYVTARSLTNFILEWQEVDVKIPTKDVSTNVSGCGTSEPINLNVLNNYTKITSPGFPDGYANGLNCEWLLTTIPMNHLAIYFLEVDLQPSFGPTCYGDFIEIFEKKIDQDWTSISRICRNNATTKTIQTTNLMKLVFKSDRFVNRTGFSAIIREVCGGVMTDPTGFIIYDNNTRPNYMRMYSGECQWNITVGPGKTIEIEFLELDIVHDKDKGCDNYLLIRNGKFPDSPILGDGKYCGTQLPAKLQTTGNNAYIKYKGLFAASSFKIKYRAVSYECGGDIILNQFANTVEINSPNYPQIPPPFVECMWRIIAPSGETIRIDFPYRFDIASEKNCNTEFVEIRDGATIYSKLIGRFCGKKPSSQFTTDNMMFVKFFTQKNEPSNGFKAKVTIGNCGGTIHSKIGQVRSPFFNVLSKYPINANCTWHLVTPPDHNMKIQFDKLDLEESSNCTEDQLLLYEPTLAGQTANLGKYCGNKLPDPISSSGNEVLVNFKTNNVKKQHAGFSLQFNASQEVCGGVVEATESVIQSPGYPNPHKSFRSCSWFLKVPFGRRITLNLLDFDLDNRFSKNWMNGVAAYNALRYQGFIKQIFSNDSNTVESCENHMHIYYWNRGGSGRGFKLRFTSNEPSYCEGNLNGESGTITQPNIRFPFYCTYIRNKPLSGSTLAMTLTTTTNSSRLKSEKSCLSHIAAFKIGSDEAKTPIKVIDCVPSKTIIRVPYSKLNLTFIQTYSRDLVNYTLSYQTYPCGGILNGEVGTIKSPGYPNKYSKTIECSWLLKIPSEQNILLTFNDLNLGDNCEKSYLDVYNGDSPSSPKIDRYCQSNKPSPIHSETNSLWVEYKFDEDSNGKGFSLSYEPKIRGCGGIFHDRTRIIQSPSFPDDYPNNAECLWELRSAEGYHIGLIFTTRFQIEQSDNCENDFLEIWDWLNNEWVSLGRKCGREFPETLNSTSNRLKILFRSNERIAGKGFRARWEWNCGGTFIASETEQFIVSPGFPVAYKPLLNCHYNISAARKSEYVNIKFYNFELEGSRSNCNYDNISITNTLYGRQARNFGFFPQTFCGTRTPPNVRMSQTIFIHFQTDKWVQKSGFKFSYQVDNCGGTITSPTTISSPPMKIERTPGLYNGYLNCVWNITAPPKKSIVINFQDFRFDYRRNCYYDNVEIYKGSAFKISNRIVNLCGDLSKNLPHFIIETNSALISMKADRHSNHDGFQAEIYFTDGPEAGCGGTILLNNTYTLVAPNLADLDCSWVIQSEAGSSIKIHFDELNLPLACGITNHTRQNCSCAFIEIRDGHPSVAETIDKFCGLTSSNYARELSSTGSTLGIRLYTRGSNRKTFRISLRKINSICGPIYLNATKDTQILTSPNYPNRYPDEIRCSWVVKSFARFTIHFVDFDLNEGDTEEDCNEDTLEILDESGSFMMANGLGPSLIVGGNKKKVPDFSRYPVMAGLHKFCGKYEKPFDYYSTFSNLVLRFSSGTQSQKRGRGFKIEYSQTGCNRNYTTLQGRVVGTISNECVQTITVPQNYTISIYFQHFLAYSSTKCEQAGIEIRDGGTKSATLLQRMCGYALPNPVFSSGNELLIFVWNKASVRLPMNYDFIYTSSDQGKGCGGSFYNYKGTFTSPFYPMSYKNSTACEWTVRIPVGMRVALSFQTFDIQGACEQNYIIVTTYEKGQGNEHKFCSSDNPATIYSNSRISIKYQSSLNNGGTGWQAAFDSVNH